MAIEIVLPTLHAGQAAIYRNRGKLNAVRCGRRWGKTKQMVTIAANGAVKRRRVGLFAPEYRQLNEPYNDLLATLQPIKASANRNTGTIRTTTGGQIDFWALNDNELAGRGREYDLVLVDEAAFTKNSQMLGIWERSIKPTMLTRPKSTAWVFSTPNGNDEENFFWRVCNDPKLEFTPHYAPTSTNPYVPADELERERQRNHPLVFQQEYLAQFVDWSGVAFFSLEKLLVDDKPVETPRLCDSVFAVIDTAVKSGADHDSTAVSYWASSPHFGYPLVCLDWDLVSLDGALLEAWIPGVFARCEELARECHARYGSQGAWIEDVNSGAVLLQQCANRGYPAQALPSKLTSVGKDVRALNVSGLVYQGKVKIARFAYEKNDVIHKGAAKNHFVSQIVSFRIGDKAAANRSDDLLDTFTYSIAIALGSPEGYG